MERRDPNALPELVREVELPPQPVSGFGIMVVASMAMLFAVVSSAFILRARMVADHCPHHHAVTTVQKAEPKDLPPCEHVIYIDLDKPVCVPSETMVEMNRTPAPKLEGMVVDHITY